MDEEVQKTTEVSSTAPQQVTTTTKKVVKPQVMREHPQKVYDTKKTIFRTYQIIWYVLGVLEVILAFRFILKILAANPLSGFASLVYSLSGPFVLPFVGVLRISTAPSVGTVFEWPTLLAMAVYWLVAFGLVQLFQFIKPV